MDEQWHDTTEKLYIGISTNSLIIIHVELTMPFHESNYPITRICIYQPNRNSLAAKIIHHCRAQ